MGVKKKLLEVFVERGKKIALYKRKTSVQKFAHRLGLLTNGISSDERLIQEEFRRWISIKDRMSLIMFDQFVQRCKRSFADEKTFAIVGRFDAKVSNGLLISSNTQRIMSDLERKAVRRRAKERKTSRTFRSLFRMRKSPR